MRKKHLFGEVQKFCKCMVEEATHWVRLTDCGLGNTAQGPRLEQPMQGPGSVSSATHILMGLVPCILSQHFPKTERKKTVSGFFLPSRIPKSLPRSSCTASCLAHVLQN